MNDTEFYDLIRKLVNSTNISETADSIEMLVGETKVHPSHSTALLEFLISAKLFAVQHNYILGVVWCNTLQNYNCHKLIRIEVTSPDSDKIALEGVSDGMCKECYEKHQGNKKEGSYMERQAIISFNEKQAEAPKDKTSTCDSIDENLGADGNPLSTAPDSLF